MAFDLSAAFDTLEHSKLLEKLETAGITGIPLKWFRSYLSDRFQSVLWNNTLSNPLALTRGVPQGSILGPNLFLVMIHDLPKYLTRNTPTSVSKSVEYADDTTAYAKSIGIEHLKKELEILASIMIEYCNRNGQSVP